MKRFPQYRAYSFNSGRSALFMILRAFGIGMGHEVLVQAFTCVAVPNSVIWTGAIPVYVDIDTTLNLDTADAEKKISSKTRAIILQHTLGTPAQADKIIAFAKRHNLIVIEDCAHSMGAKYDGKLLGSLSDASFFSFGRDKILSSVFGGMALMHTKHIVALQKLKTLHKELARPRLFWIFQQLLHPVVFSLILPFYNIGVGKVILVTLQTLRLLSFPVYAEEKKSKKPGDFPLTYPNALAELLLLQLKKLDLFNRQRQVIARSYYQGLKNRKQVELFPYDETSVYLRFPIMVENPDMVIKKARRSGVLLGTWYHNVVDPAGVDFKKAYYKVGSCPRAEYVSKRIINLPTRITKKEAAIVLSVFHNESK